MSNSVTIAGMSGHVRRNTQLHAILLHRGLTTDLLTLLLPSPRARIASQLLRLQALGLLTRDGERWQVAPLAYSTVREFLRVRRYLTDAF